MAMILIPVSVSTLRDSRDLPFMSDCSDSVCKRIFSSASLSTRLTMGLPLGFSSSRSTMSPAALDMAAAPSATWRRTDSCTASCLVRDASIMRILISWLSISILEPR